MKRRSLTAFILSLLLLMTTVESTYACYNPESIQKSTNGALITGSTNSVAWAGAFVVISIPLSDIETPSNPFETGLNGPFDKDQSRHQFTPEANDCVQRLSDHIYYGRYSNPGIPIVFRKLLI